MNKRIAFLIMAFFALIAGPGWAEVVSETTYDTKTVSTLPDGWTGAGGGSSYIQLVSPDHHITTDNFTQNGFTSIVLKARKYGSSSDAHALITVSWFDAATSTETVLGTITPTNTTLKSYTIDSPSNPKGNTSGYIKIQCKEAGSNQGSGISQVTINYTTGSNTVSSCTIDPTSHDFGEITVGNNATFDFTVTTANLTEDLTLEVSDGFSVSPTTIESTATETTITVTCTPTAVGELNGTLTISGDDFTDDITAVLSAIGTCTDPMFTEFSETACETYTWNGNTYTTSGDYKWEGQTVNGCDSIVTLHLTINQPTSYEFSETACETYTWNGNTYTTSGDYKWEGQTVNGCDSIVTLHLTINQPTSFEFSETACESYTWNGNTYTTSGEYKWEGQTVNGCDSIVTLHLTINQTVTANESISICASELPYTWNDVVFSEAGSQTITLTAANGCDSTLTMTVYVTEINTGIELLEPDCMDCSIHAVFQDNAEYQWINCNNNTPIENATNFEFKPTETGNYACVINVGGCSDTTECVQVVRTDILEDYASYISIYPNPTSSICNVECDIENAEFQLYDATGKCVITQKSDGKLTSINVSNLVPGIYLLQIVVDGKNVGMAKVVRE